VPSFFDPTLKTIALYMPMALIGIIFVFINLLVRFGHSLKLPILSVLLFVGYIIGEQGLQVLPVISADLQRIITYSTMTLVGLLMGTKLFHSKKSKENLFVAFAIVLVTATFIFLPVFLLSGSFVLSIIISIIGAFTAPTHTIVIIEETHTKGIFSNQILGYVLFSEVIALLLFSAVLHYINIGASNFVSDLHQIKTFFVTISISAFAAVVLSIPTTLICRAIPGEKFRVPEAIGIVLFISSLSLMFDLSPIITSIVIGYLIAWGTQNRSGTLSDIDNIEWLIFIPFFIIAGSNLDFSSLMHVGGIGLAFVVARSAGRIVSGIFASSIQNSKKTGKGYWIGLSLLPQGGIAIGAVWLTQGVIPDPVYTSLVSIILGATVFFEIIGPILLRYSLNKNKH